MSTNQSDPLHAIHEISKRAIKTAVEDATALDIGPAWSTGVLLALIFDTARALLVIDPHADEAIQLAVRTAKREAVERDRADKAH